MSSIHNFSFITVKECLCKCQLGVGGWSKQFQNLSTQFVNELTSSQLDFPLTTLPSTGTLAPGKTFRMSPRCKRSTDTGSSEMGFQEGYPYITQSFRYMKGGFHKKPCFFCFQGIIHFGLQQGGGGQEMKYFAYFQ